MGVGRETTAWAVSRQRYSKACTMRVGRVAAADLRHQHKPVVACATEPVGETTATSNGPNGDMAMQIISLDAYAPGAGIPEVITLERCAEMTRLPNEEEANAQFA